MMLVMLEMLVALVMLAMFEEVNSNGVSTKDIRYVTHVDVGTWSYM